MDIFTYAFMQRALLAALLSGLLSPAIGTYIVQRRLTLLGDGLGHVAVAGVGLSFLTNTAPMPLAIAVCAETASYPEGDLAWVEDCSAALENILVAAKGLGLDGVWLKVMGRHPRNELVRPVLGVPESVQIVGIAALGFGAEEKSPCEGIKEDRVHKNRW